MKEANKYLSVIIVSLIIGLTIGFLGGRKTMSIDESIEYVKGATLEDSISIHEPISEIVPLNPVFFFRTDTVDRIEVQVVDTALIIADWVKGRAYKELLFDNENGKLSFDATVQYNKLQDLKYTFTPIQKVITRNKQRVLIPFVGVSYSTFDFVSVGGGLFYHDLGVELRYVTDFERKGVDIGLKYKS